MGRNALTKGCALFSTFLILISCGEKPAQVKEVRDGWSPGAPRVKTPSGVESLQGGPPSPRSYGLYDELILSDTQFQGAQVHSACRVSENAPHEADFELKNSSPTLLSLLPLRILSQITSKNAALCQFTVILENSIGSTRRFFIDRIGVVSKTEDPQIPLYQDTKPLGHHVLLDPFQFAQTRFETSGETAAVVCESKVLPFPLKDGRPHVFLADFSWVDLFKKSPLAPRCRGLVLRGGLAKDMTRPFQVRAVPQAITLQEQLAILGMKPPNKKNKRLLTTHSLILSNVASVPVEIRALTKGALTLEFTFHIPSERNGFQKNAQLPTHLTLEGGQSLGHQVLALEPGQTLKATLSTTQPLRCLDAVYGSKFQMQLLGDLAFEVRRHPSDADDEPLQIIRPFRELSPYLFVTDESGRPARGTPPRASRPTAGTQCRSK